MKGPDIKKVASEYCLSNRLSYIFLDSIYLLMIVNKPVDEKDVTKMRRTRINIIVFLSLLGFFLGVTAIAFHHHDNAFLLPACSLCKAKTSFSGTVNKLKANASPAVLILSFSLTAMLLCTSCLAPDRKKHFIDFQIIDTYPNKAPPFHFSFI